MGSESKDNDPKLALDSTASVAEADSVRAHSTAGYTPGPWAAMEYSAPSMTRPPLRIAIHSTQRVDDVPSPVVAELEGRRMRANARLIAAAPDLYEILSILVDRLDNIGYDKRLGDNLMQAARMRLAKAEGRS